MPIKINLLAEAQAADEARRRDPVKRAIWVSALVIGIMLVWGGVEFSKTMLAKANLEAQDKQWRLMETNYNMVVAKEKLTGDLQKKLGALTSISTNRFLWGNGMNAMQHIIPVQMLDQLQIISVRSHHTYGMVDTPIPGARREPNKPAPKTTQATEKITLQIEARDFGNQQDQNWQKLKSSIFTVPFFKTNLVNVDNINLKNRSATPVPDQDGRLFTTFTLECAFPEKRRDEPK